MYDERQEQEKLALEKAVMDYYNRLPTDVRLDLKPWREVGLALAQFPNE